MLLKKLVLMILILIAQYVMGNVFNCMAFNMKEFNVIGRNLIPDTAELHTVYLWTLADNMTSKLIYLDHRGDIQPFLAKFWKIKPDGKKYTFYLNEQAKFSDGKQINAQDVVFTFKRLILLNYGLHYKIRELLVDSEKFKKIDENIDGVKAVSEYIVEFNLKHRQENFIFLLSLADSGIISRNTINKSFKIANWNISSGAYFMATKGDDYKLKSNSNFLFNQNPYFNTINLKGWTSNNQELLSLFRNHKVDFADYWLVPNDNIIEQANKMRLKVILGSLNMNHYFLISTKIHPNLGERQRIASLLTDALDGIEINSTAYQKPSFQYLPDYMYGSITASYKFKREDSKVGLKNVKKISLYVFGDKYTNGNFLESLLLNIQNKKLPLTIKSLELNSLLKKKLSLDFDAILKVMSLSEKYIESCLQFCISTEIYKKTELYSRLDKLLHKGMQSDTKIEKAKYFREISRILVEESVIVPIAYTATTFITRPNIEFVDFNPFDGKLEFWKIREKEL